MKISDIMTEKSVVMGIKANSKRQLLQELAQKASEITGINDRTIFDTILERENLGSSGFGAGTALPHGRIADIDKVYGIVTKLNTPVDFESIDGKPVDLVFMLISPEGSGADHLTALAQVSRILKDEATCSKLRAASRADEIFSLLNN